MPRVYNRQDKMAPAGWRYCPDCGGYVEEQHFGYCQDARCPDGGYHYRYCNYHRSARLLAYYQKSRRRSGAYKTITKRLSPPSVMPVEKVMKMKVKYLPECIDCAFKTRCPFVDPGANRESDVFRPVQDDGARLCVRLVR
jgi:hypothetical protein